MRRRVWGWARHPAMWSSRSEPAARCVRSVSHPLLMKAARLRGSPTPSAGTHRLVSPPTLPQGWNSWVAGFADALGGYLPVSCTLNAARVLDSVARVLGVDHAELGRLALAAPAGS